MIGDSLLVTLGYKCNFNCKYCFESKLNQKSKADITDDILDRSIELIDYLSKDCEAFTVYLYGGEPLFYKKEVERLFLNYRDTPKINFNIFTNGSLIEDYKDLFLEFRNRMFFNFSYDYEPLQSKNRKCYSDKNNNPVINSLYWLARNNFDFKVKSTFTDEEICDYLFDSYMDYYRIQKDMKSKYNRTFLYRPSIDHLHRSEIDYAKLADQFNKLCDFFKQNRLYQTGFNWFDKVVRERCNHDTMSLTVDCNGDLTLCCGNSFTDGKEFTPVNIMEDISIEECLNRFRKYLLFIDSINYEAEECRKCNATMCVRCGLIKTIENNSFDHWSDPHTPNICKIYKYISGYVRAYNRFKKI